MVTVAVVKAFDHEGRHLAAGDRITVEPVIASALAFRGVVSLLESVGVDIRPMMEPVAPPVVPETKVMTPASPRRTRKAGTYRRRDMRAQG